MLPRDVELLVHVPLQVKVWLGEDNHYYVLSRFLLSRMLTVIKVPNVVAVKIALSQPDWESSLFKVSYVPLQPPANAQNVL